MTNRPRGRTRILSDALPDLTRRAFARRGFAGIALATDWPHVVGTALADHTLPERLVFPRGERTGGTLHIRVGSAIALELQHLEPLVIERINRHFGYAAVARLALTQGPVEPRARPPRETPVRLTETQERAIDERLSGIDDESLRRSLEGLARAMVGRQNRAGS